MPRTTRDFQGSTGKIFLRRSWDYPIIRDFQVSLGRPLRYFGLPGPGIEDVTDWQESIGHVAAVERLRRGRFEVEDQERIRRLHRNLLSTELEYEVLRGEIEDVILKRRDLDGNAPLFLTRSDEGTDRMEYDLLNLDFCGGVGFRPPRGRVRIPSKRVEALEQLIRLQHGHPSLLFVTYAMRDALEDELTGYLTGVRGEFDVPLRAAVDWYAARGAGERKYKLKAVIADHVLRVAENSRFQVLCYPPVVYSGIASTTMLHFAFLLTPTTSEFRAFSRQSRNEVLQLPLLQCHDDRIEFASPQHDGFDWAHCRDHLDFVPAPHNRLLQRLAENEGRAIDEVAETVSE